MTVSPHPFLSQKKIVRMRRRKEGMAIPAIIR